MGRLYLTKDIENAVCRELLQDGGSLQYGFCVTPTQNEVLEALWLFKKNRLELELMPIMDG